MYNNNSIYYSLIITVIVVYLCRGSNPAVHRVSCTEMSGSSRRAVSQIAAATSKHRTTSTAAVSSVTASPHNITTDHTAPPTQRTEAAAAEQSIKQWEDLPGPLSLPLIGSSYALFFGKRNRAQLHEKSVSNSQSYNPLMK